MLSPYFPPQNDPPEVSPTRGLVWILQAAFALLAIAAWLFLMLHVVLVVRAEYKLRDMLDQASRFSELPQVSQQELSQFVRDRTEARGWTGATIAIGPHNQKPGNWQVNSLSLPVSEVMPIGMQSLAERMGAPPRLLIQAFANSHRRVF